MKIIKEAYDDNGLYVRAWIGNLGKYNEGELVGEWVEFPISDEEFEEVMNRIEIGDEYEETFVADYDSTLPLYEMFGEYPDFEDLNELGEFCEEVNSNGDDVLIRNAMELTDNVQELKDAYENGDITFLEGVRTDEQLGYCIIEDIYGGADKLDKETLEKYFDYAEWGRVLNMDSYDNYEDDPDGEPMSAGEYFCGDDSATDFEIGSADVEMNGLPEKVEYYFDYDMYGRDTNIMSSGMFTADGWTEVR